MKDKILAALADLGITYQMSEHPPAFTVEQINEFCTDLPGLHCKNLFFRNTKGKRHFLYVLPADKAVNIKELGAKIGQRLSFASDERLDKYLAVKAGSVSPLGLLFDTEKAVELLLDESLSSQSSLNFHPNDNRFTLGLSYPDLLKFLAHWGGEFQILKD